ncbi:MAG: hypothetical protein AB8F26_11820 [Phycisphaerales bacterium]
MHEGCTSIPKLVSNQPIFGRLSHAGLALFGLDHESLGLAAQTQSY